MIDSKMMGTMILGIVRDSLANPPSTVTFQLPERIGRDNA
jgi:hypothetical protein